MYQAEDAQGQAAVNVRELNDFLKMSEQMCERLGDPVPASFHCRGKQVIHMYVLSKRHVLYFETKEDVEWDQIDEEVSRVRPRIEAVLNDYGDPK